jgi:hypothetical protein
MAPLFVLGSYPTSISINFEFHNSTEIVVFIVLLSKSWYTTSIVFLHQTIVRETMNTKNMFTLLISLMISAIPTAHYACSFSAEQDGMGLSSESQQLIGFSAFKGAVAGVSSYVLGYWLSHDYKLPRISEHPLAYGLWALAGATLMGLWRSQYTPEAYYSYAQDGIIRILDEGIIAMITEAEPAQIAQVLKDQFFKHKFPLFMAFRYLETRYDLLEQYKDALYQVLQSSRTDLHTQSFNMLEAIDMCQGIIKMGITQLKEDPKFIEECNAQTMVEIQHAQMVAADAAHSNAVASWVNALRPTSVVVYSR